ALGGAEAIDALDDIGARVEEELVDLGEGKVVGDGELEVEALDREGEARGALLAGEARADGADAEGRGLGAAVSGGEAAGPVVPGEDGRDDSGGSLLARGRGGHEEAFAGDRAGGRGGADLAGEDVGLGGSI